MKHAILYIVFAISFTTIGQTRLQYNLNVGDKFTVHQAAKQHITQDLNGAEQIIENNLMASMDFEVVEKSTDHYTLKMSFKRLKIQMSSPTLGELSNSDTESADSSDVTTMMFKGLLGVPVTILMSKAGKVESVTGGDKLIDAMFVSAGIDQPEIIEASRGQMEKQFGSDALSNSFEQMTYFYPLDTVTVGQEWSNSYSGNMSAKNNWKLENISEKSVNISGYATTTMSTIDENVVMTLNGTQNTTVVANPNTRLFSLVSVVSINSGDTFLQSQNMTVPTTIKSTITYKILP